MNIEIAAHERMSESGKSLLRLIQNNSMPILDLLVRESVQNSLDAASPDSEHVDIDFIISKFKSSDLNRHLEIISENLNKKYPDITEYDFLAIQDMNTTGLTGPMTYEGINEENFGNLLKLVYEICVPQQGEGKGGSWGIGKTVYFRIGIGLVLYYTRILDENGNYQSRLAATFVEDQTQQDSFLPPYPAGGIKRGIAWWGEKYSQNKTRPITDEENISEILEIFNIKKYEENQTGTTIIIPYIDVNSLLPTYNDESHDQHRWWHDSLEDYIKIALQRWYAVRLQNSQYDGKWLNAKINGIEIERHRFLPVFDIIQKLYNKIDDPRFIYKDITTNNMLFRQKVGSVHFVKFTSEELRMIGSGNNQPDPFSQTNIFDNDIENNAPILAYMRRPGMVISYETTGKWVEGIAKTPKNEYIIALFILNSENKLNQNYDNISLEEYVRKSEMADHSSWNDWVNYNWRGGNPLLITKIQRSTRNYIAREFKVNDQTNNQYKNIALSRLLAKKLLPPVDFGNHPGNGANGNGNSGGGNSKGKRSTLTLEPPFKYEKNRIGIDFILFFGSINQTLKIQINIESESGKINADDWERNIGAKFPVIFDSVILEKFRTSPKHKLSDLCKSKITQQSDNSKEKDITMKYMYSSRLCSRDSFIISVPENTGYYLKGRVWLIHEGQAQISLNIAE